MSSSSGLSDRRDFLIQTGALLASAVLAGRCGSSSAAAPPAAAAAEQTPSDRLDSLLARLFEERMREDPQGMTSLGLDHGAGEWAKSKLNSRSAAQVQRMIGLRQRWLRELTAFDATGLSGLPATNLQVVRYESQLALRGAQSFSYGRDGFPAPYVLSQITGSYQSVPDFLDTQHRIAERSDAEAYLARLNDFARVLREETDWAAANAAAGVRPPGFIVEKTLAQLRLLRNAPLEEGSLVASLVRRTNARGIAGDWSRRAAALVAGPVHQALDAQIALVQEWRNSPREEAGVWSLPQGEEYYRFAAHYQTTTSLRPEEIHALGLELVAQLSSELDTLLKRQGMTAGPVGARMASLYKDPRFIYPDSEAGRAALLRYLNDRVEAVTAVLPRYFGTLPKAGLEIRRVPVANEIGSPGGYYEDGSLDGSRPGAYYINLRDMGEVPRWTLATLTYHEGIPGHHLQGALVLEAGGLPMLRRTLWFAAYGEGWALYAEQLADEMGMYADDPWGRVGYLHDALFRAVRLVLDSGLHAKRWTREQSIRYFMDTMGDPRSSATTEVDRYCVWPGQASSYMIGKMTWLRLRSKAQRLLGAKFDIRRFHDAGLLSGPMPLELLESWINEWTARGGV